ncbi:MAG: hypothetical protein L0Y72_26360 [Gemmataceae bacterium]|nr:hypothetical protein [Gemmataceae bacterium]
MAEHKDHWQQLAEELGLPPDEQAAGASPPAAAVQAPPPREAPAPAREEHAPIQSTPPADYNTLGATNVVSLGDDDLDDLPEEGPGEAPPDSLPAGDDKAPEIAAPVSDKGEEDRRPRRGRRRGGRRRGGRDDRPPPRGQARAPAEEDEPEAPGWQERDEGDMPARGQGRAGLERDEEEAFDERDEPEEIVPAIEEDDDADDDLSQFANWNLPSWQELISSLYRPDRNDRER